VELGYWGLRIGPNPQSPIPNPQSPIPNSPKHIFKILLIIYELNIIYFELNEFLPILVNYHFSFYFF